MKPFFSKFFPRLKFCLGVPTRHWRRSIPCLIFGTAFACKPELAIAPFVSDNINKVGEDFFTVATY